MDLSKNPKKLALEYGEEKRQDMASIAPKGLVLPKDSMATKTSYERK